MSKRRNKVSNKIHDNEAGSPEILSRKATNLHIGQQRTEKAHEQKLPSMHQNLADSSKNQKQLSGRKRTHEKTDISKQIMTKTPEKNKSQMI